MRCFHDDFLGWGIGDTAPTTKPDRRAFSERGFVTQERVFTHLNPVAITVRGNKATVLYVATFTDKNRETGVETTRTERWTDICLKENGRWQWVADHGVLISEG